MCLLDFYFFKQGPKVGKKTKNINLFANIFKSKTALARAQGGVCVFWRKFGQGLSLRGNEKIIFLLFGVGVETQSDCRYQEKNNFF